ncbi:hypothetical protein [uncultured Sphingomonas sp.]|uniref:hypothetical protein n=1 Tax=uncultured Sphingomonas sp. TaxID=158754 RepID=UPI0035CB968E
MRRRRRTGRSRGRRAVGRTLGFSLWLALVSLFLLWQAATYRGFMSLVGEWQFNAFGRHYPTFNYVVLVFLLGLPGYLLFLRPRKPRREERPESALMRSATAFLKALFGVAAGLGGAMLLVALLLLFLPRESGELQRIDLSRPLVAQPHDGPAILSGDIIYERTAGFDEDLLVARRSFRFTPVIGVGNEPGDLRFFVQLPPADERTRRGVRSVKGVLKRNGLPGEIVRLFRYAGYRLDEPHYVLFAEPAAMRWPYRTALAQFAVGAVLALLFALLQRRRIGRFGEREPKAELEPEPAVEPSARPV